MEYQIWLTSTSASKMSCPLLRLASYSVATGFVSHSFDSPHHRCHPWRPYGNCKNKAAPSLKKWLKYSLRLPPVPSLNAETMKRTGEDVKDANTFMDWAERWFLRIDWREENFDRHRRLLNVSGCPNRPINMSFQPRAKSFLYTTSLIKSGQTIARQSTAISSNSLLISWDSNYGR